MTILIWDTDVGNDDLMAGVYLKSQNTNIAAVTVASSGGINGAKRAQNIADFYALLGHKDMPIAYGNAASVGHCVNPFPPYFLNMMDNILQGRNIPPNTNAVIPLAPSAVELLKTTIESADEPVTILATGPLTNIAEFLQTYPGLKNKIEKIVIMGGAVDKPGNIKALHHEYEREDEAEWNIIIDPLAAQVVFSSEIPVTLVPLDATNQIPMTMEFYNFFQQHESHPELKLLYELQRLIVDGFPDGIGKYKNGTELFLKEFYLWDPLAAMICLHPEIAIGEDMFIKVELETAKTQLVAEGTQGAARINVIKQFHNPNLLLQKFMDDVQKYFLDNKATVSALSIYQAPTATAISALEIALEEAALNKTATRFT